MRTKSSIKNAIATLIVQILNVVIGMVSTTLFIRFLNIEYRGINGLFYNIVSMLSITELGFGNAIIVNLYEPLHNSDIEEVKSLMHFYKKIYNIIILIILTMGLLLIPFLDIIVGPITIEVNLKLVYILILFSSISSYFLAYKRSILYATQKDYILKIISILYIIICNFFQITSLYLTKNYYLYLIIRIICQILENIVISIIVDKRYEYLKDKKYTKLSNKTEKNIWKKVKALSIQKICNSVVTNSDNIIMSSFLGIVSVGIYTNYYTIINNVKSLIYESMSSTIAPLGDMLIEKNFDKNYNVYKKIKFLNFWIALFSAICLLVITQDFICIWIGKKYLLSEFTLLILVINFYQKIIQRTYRNFKDAAGIWEKDKYIPILELIINIITSIVLLKVFGLAGIFMGTIISSLPYWFYSYPIFIYKGLFKRSYWKYILEMLEYIILFVFIGGVTYFVASLFVVKNLLLQVFVDLIVCIIIPNILLLLIYRKTDEFRYFFNLMKNIFFKRKIY